MKWKRGTQKTPETSDGKPEQSSASKAKDLKQMVATLKGKNLPEKKEKKEEPTGSGLKNEKGLKMVFAMSDQKEDGKDDQKTIKILTKKDNRVMEDVITENLVVVLMTTQERRCLKIKLTQRDRDRCLHWQRWRCICWLEPPSDCWPY